LIDDIVGGGVNMGVIEDWVDVVDGGEGLVDGKVEVYLMAK
jgi:hypothetical protein